jgi:hypothetical protein
VWGELELEPEVEEWITALNHSQFGQATRHLERLMERGPLLGEPATRQLRGKLRELRLYVDEGPPVRITYYIATGRRIVLLTVFRKQRQREHQEIARAERAMARCITEGHEVEDDD